MLLPCMGGLLHWAYRSYPCRLKASDGCGRKAFLLAAGPHFMFAAERTCPLPSDAGDDSVSSVHARQPLWLCSEQHHSTLGLHTMIACCLQHIFLEEDCPYMRASPDRAQPNAPLRFITGQALQQERNPKLRNMVWMACKGLSMPYCVCRKHEGACEQQQPDQEGED